MRERSAEVVVDEPLARRLLGQFPDLAVDSLELIAEGWDNAVWLVDGTWAFRFPRRSIAIAGVEREIAVLPRLPLPIPVPTFVGRPAHGYPWAFFGARFLPGREIADADLSDDVRNAIAPLLGSFLHTLHAADAEAFAAELPADPMGRADMAARVPRTRDRLNELAALGLWEAPPSVEAVLAAAERLPPPAATVVAHGDFHFRHILVDAAGAPCASSTGGTSVAAIRALTCRCSGASSTARVARRSSMLTVRSARTTSCGRAFWRSSSAPCWRFTPSTRVCRASSAKRWRSSRGHRQTED